MPGLLTRLAALLRPATPELRWSTDTWTEYTSTDRVEHAMQTGVFTWCGRRAVSSFDPTVTASAIRCPACVAALNPDGER